MHTLAGSMTRSDSPSKRSYGLPMDTKRLRLNRIVAAFQKVALRQGVAVSFVTISN